MTYWSWSTKLNKSSTLLFRQHLDSHHLLSDLIHALINLPEAALAQLLVQAHHEIIDTLLFHKWIDYCKANRMYNSLRRGFAALSPLRIFQDRGLLFQSTQQPLLQSSDFVSEVKQVENGKCAAYCGYDPTSDSLHLGNLVSILMMGRLAQQGI